MGQNGSVGERSERQKARLCCELCRERFAGEVPAVTVVNFEHFSQVIGTHGSEACPKCGARYVAAIAEEPRIVWKWVRLKVKEAPRIIVPATSLGSRGN